MWKKKRWHHPSSWKELNLLLNLCYILLFLEICCLMYVEYLDILAFWFLKRQGMFLPTCPYELKKKEHANKHISLPRPNLFGQNKTFNTSTICNFIKWGAYVFDWYLKYMICIPKKESETTIKVLAYLLYKYNCRDNTEISYNLPFVCNWKKSDNNWC